MSPTALWIPFGVEDLDGATSFYVDRLGLSVVDSWDRGGERGVVLRAAGAAFVELVTPDPGGVPALAFELATESDVDGHAARWRPAGDDGPAVPHRHPRGHYGFTVPGPAGASVMIWSER